jgi:drug/metabolite transporter (DMT)-like permease
MIYLLLSILTSVIVVCYFKLFDIYKVNTLQAIVVNYLTCAIMGNLLADKPGILTPFWNEGWFPYTLVLGSLFIRVFYSIAQTAQRISVSVSMVAAKLSVALPVIFSIVIYHEPVNVMKVTGIILSLVAVYFISSSDSETSGHRLWYLPLFVFAGSGLIDTLLNHINVNFIPPFDTNHILSFVFLTAFVLGGVMLGSQIIAGKQQPGIKHVLWGIALGIPNYMCMYFLLKTLDSFPHASVILPVNNIGIVMLTTVAGLLLFREKMKPVNWVGLLLAIGSILILSYC